MRFSLLGAILLLGAAAGCGVSPQPQASPSFNGQRAYADVLAQDSFGARFPGTSGHARTIEYIRAELEKAGWQSEVILAEQGGREVQNIRAWRQETPPVLLFGAHYDTRIFADSDPDPANRTLPVPGANDGASGVAVLLELARSLPANSVAVELAFFDAEDNGRIPGWDWIWGSRAYVVSLKTSPAAVVVVDMIGDADLNIYQERNSDPRLRASIWQAAEKAGYAQNFIPEEKYQMLDDHIPFLEAGIPAVDLIDFDYPYWHTIQDTPDKVSAQSLQAVGDTLLLWLSDYGNCLAQRDYTQANCNAP